MDNKFWHQKWEKNEINFHQPEVHPFLAKYLPTFQLKKESRIFLPLCGKTLDIAWLISNGYKVVGIELVELAIEQLFHELNLKPVINSVGKLKHYSAHNIDIFVGDYFELSKENLGQVDLVYDRAALVALPQDLRLKYAAHLIQITNFAPQMLITFEYDQSKIDGPPFSLVSEEIHRHYELNYDLKILESFALKNGMKGVTPANESIWSITKK